MMRMIIFLKIMEFLTIFLNFFEKKLGETQKSSGIFFQLKRMEKKPHTNNSNTTWVHFLEKYNVKL
jgi:hypothetical protein